LGVDYVSTSTSRYHAWAQDGSFIGGVLMRQEVIDFYEAHRIPVKRMIAIGVNRRGLRQNSIEAAAEAVYDDIQAGLQLKPTRIAWEVFNRSTPIRNQTASLHDISNTIEKLSNDIAALKVILTTPTPWYIKLWRKLNGLS